MATTYLKKATKTPATGDQDTQNTVRDMLQSIRTGGEDAATGFARKLDGWDGDIIVSRETIEAATKVLPESVKDDIRFARDRICAFAEQQRDSVREFEIDLLDGLVAGQKVIPITTAGCYVPGGRYSHAASALMSVGTARVAGVQHVIAATPAQKDRGINPGILYAMEIAGADTILELLAREGTLLSRATIWRLLRAEGKITPQPQKRPRSSWLRFNADRRLVTHRFRVTSVTTHPLGTGTKWYHLVQRVDPTNAEVPDGNELTS